MIKMIQFGKYHLAWRDHPLLMGIVNLTPDSFSGDGLASDAGRAIDHARRQLEAGADILDVGAESTRPGALPTPEDEELARLLPVLRELVSWGVPVSVDTCKPRVMRAAIEIGASMINDITGMSSPESLAAVADSDCAVCVMHMQGQPRSMQQAPEYVDVVAEVAGWLGSAALRCRQAGIADERIVLDPGFGFGKTLAHNLALFRALPADVWGGLPLLVGVSRKSMLGLITGSPVEKRQAASVAAALMAAQRGAAILRVHDVAETRDALAVWSAVVQGEKND